jgi:hypothetical protein
MEPDTIYRPYIELAIRFSFFALLYYSIFGKEKAINDIFAHLTNIV